MDTHIWQVAKEKYKDLIDLSGGRVRTPLKLDSRLSAAARQVADPNDVQARVRGARDALGAR